MAKQKSNIIIERQYAEVSSPEEVKKAEECTVEAFKLLLKFVGRDKERLVS